MPALFHRLDDAGKSKSVTEFCEALVSEGISVAVAVVPSWLNNHHARRLARLPKLTVLQHGYSHINRRRFGFPDEFPDTLLQSEIRHQIQDGRLRLENVFGRPVNIYVPPWNRISRRAYTTLIELDFVAVSGHARFPIPSVVPAASHGAVKTVPVSVDTVRSYAPLRLHAPSNVLAAIAAERQESVGVMYHVEGLSKSKWRCAVDLARQLAITYPTISLGDVLWHHV